MSAGTASDPLEQSRLLITGASGQLARLTAGLLLAQRRAEDLILVTRTPGKLGDLAAQGVDVRYGDFGEPESLRDAFAGGQRMLLISASDIEQRAEQQRVAIRAAAAAGVSHIVYTSALNPEPPNPALIAPSHHATERALAESKLAWTVLRNSLYSEYQVAEAAAAISAGELVHNRGDGRIAYVSRADCAAVAASVLATAGHESRVYDVTGPQLFSASELAGLYCELGGRNVAATGLDDDAFMRRVQAAAGDDDHARYGARLVASLGRSIREGYMAAESDVVVSLAHRQPRTLRSVLETGLGEAGPVGAA